MVISDPPNSSFASSAPFEPCNQYDYGDRHDTCDQAGDVTFPVVWGIGDRIKDERPPRDEGEVE